MNNKVIWITSSNNNYNKLINKLSNLDIIVLKIVYKNGFVYLKVYQKDYKTIKMYLPTYEFKIVRESGFFYIKFLINKYLYYLVSIIIGLIFLYFISHIIVDVKVIHSSKKIRELVTLALEEKGLKRLTFKKDFRELEKIKEDILNEYQDDLEWLEIETRGMKYIIRVEQRLLNKEAKSLSSCHVIANKSGIITDIIVYSGEASVSRGDYVNEGDIIINGSIYLNDEIKNTVCADGIVKAEVWYTANVSLPLEYNKVIKTGKKKTIFVIEKGLKRKEILSNKYKYYVYKDQKIFSLLDFKIFKRKIEEVKIKHLKYSSDEAISKAFLLAMEKIKLSKKDKDRIISQKVLKKQLNNSTINLEVFFAVEEQIGKKISFIIDEKVE